MKIYKTIALSVVLACTVLLTAGYAYLELAQHMDALIKEPLLPTIPFSKLPYEIGFWKGEDQPLRETILEVAGNDDYVNRLYQYKDFDYQVNLYIAFTSQPRNMLGHRPEACYPGAGWVQDYTEKQEIELGPDSNLPVLLHYFHKPMTEQAQIVVLNYYIINGEVTTDHRDFTGILWRLPRLSEKQIRYVAQVQISSTSTAAAISFAKEIAPVIPTFMPVENSQTMTSKE